MATNGENRWPPMGRFGGRLWGGFHGHRQLLCFPLAMGIEIVRSARVSRRADARATLYAAGTSMRTQTY